MGQKQRQEKKGKTFLFYEIDQHNLDKEWVDQPKYYHEYAIKLADARHKLEEAKGELEVVIAELDNAIRREPEEYDLEKPTEPAIKATIYKQSEYQYALDTVNDAKRDVGIYQAAIDTLDHRKKALENLVRLFLADYFSDPRTHSDDENDEEFDDRINEMKKKKARRRGKE